MRDERCPQENVLVVGLSDAALCWFLMIILPPHLGFFRMLKIAESNLYIIKALRETEGQITKGIFIRKFFVIILSNNQNNHQHTLRPKERLNANRSQVWPRDLLYLQ